MGATLLCPELGLGEFLRWRLVRGLVEGGGGREFRLVLRLLLTFSCTPSLSLVRPLLDESLKDREARLLIFDKCLPALLRDSQLEWETDLEIDLSPDNWRRPFDLDLL